jgi:hypothetical protein
MTASPRNRVRKISPQKVAQKKPEENKPVWGAANKRNSVATKTSSSFK